MLAIIRPPRVLLTTVGLLIWGMPGLIAQSASADAQSEAYRASVAQDTLKRDAGAIRSELESLREEMAELAPTDAKTVERAVSRLDELSEGEMDTAVEALRDASRSDVGTAREQSVASAMEAQVAIGSSLKRMAGDLSTREALRDLRPQILALLERQAAATNILERVSARVTDPKKVSRDKILRDSGDLARFSVVSGDQRSIGEDIGIFLGGVAQIEGELSLDARTSIDRILHISQARQLTTLTVEATKLVEEGPLDGAVTAARSIQDALGAMLATLASTESTADQLATVSAKVDEMLALQAEVVENTDSLKKKGVSSEDNARQAGLIDQAELAAALATPVNAEVARKLDDAKEAMEAALEQMGRKPDLAALGKAQQAATAALEEAKTALAEASAAAQSEAPATPEALAAALDSLRQEAAQAAARQEAIAQATANVEASSDPGSPLPAPLASAQEQQTQKVEALQAQAAAVSSEAAAALGEAAAAMSEPDAASQKEAAQALTAAAQTLARQQAAVAGQTPEQRALEKTASQLAQVQSAVKQAESTLAEGASSSAQATNELAAAREALAAAQAAAKAQSSTPSESNAALAEAAKALGQAQMQAAQTQNEAASSSAEAAKFALAAAQSALAAASEEARSNAMGSLSTSASMSQAAAMSQQDSASSGGTASEGYAIMANVAGDAAQVVSGITPKERAAVAVLQNEKVPREFVPAVQQYYKNIADGAGL